VNIAKEINEVWELVNETSLLLSQTSVKNHYADHVTTLQRWLQHCPVNQAILHEARNALKELRKRLRFEGYDLSMGKYKLIFDGFHNDEVFGKFKRMVLYIDINNMLYWITGDANHQELGQMLEKRISLLPCHNLIGKHYLWFMWTRTTLTISGAASESMRSYIELKAYAEADSLKFLSYLKKLR